MELQSEVLAPRRGDEVEFRDGNLVWFYCTVLREANVDGLVEVFFPCDRTKELVDPKRLRLATADSSVHGRRRHLSTLSAWGGVWCTVLTRKEGKRIGRE